MASVAPLTSLGRSGGAVPDDQPVRKNDGDRRKGLPLDDSKQEPDGLLSDFLDGLRDRCQRRGRAAGERNVVKSDDGQILRHRETATPSHAEHR